MTRDELVDLTRRFLDAFNRKDLDAVMEFFADDGIYDEFNGKRNVGKAAIRATFVPQFTSAFGTMRFLDDFADAMTDKVMASWRCTLSVHGEPTSWRGLDLMHFVGGGKLIQKLTYAKTKVPLLRDSWIQNLGRADLQAMVVSPYIRLSSKETSRWLTEAQLNGRMPPGIPFAAVRRSAPAASIATLKDSPNGFAACQIIRSSKVSI